MTALLAAALATAVAAEPVADSCEDRVAALETRVAELERPAATASEPGSLVVPAGTTRDSLVSLTGPVDVYGTVTGEVIAVGGDVRLHPGARVEGDAVSLGGVVVQAPDAVLLGEAVDLRSPRRERHQQQPEARSAHHAAWWMGLAGLSVLVGGLWPGRIQVAGGWVQRQPFRTGLVGFAISSTVASLALVLGITIIGLPVSAGLLLLLAMAWVLGFAALCRVLGAQVPGFRQAQGWTPVLLGLAAVAVASVLSQAGVLIVALLAMPAVGAAALSRLGTRSAAPADALDG